MRAIQTTVGFLFAALVAQSAFAGQTGIQMMPPVGFDNQTVCGQTDKNTNYTAGTGLLYWDGASAIKCIPGFVGNSTGDVGLGASTPLAKLDIVTNPDSYGFGGIYIRSPSYPDTSPGITFDLGNEADPHNGAAIGAASFNGAYSNDSQPGDFIMRSGLGGNIRFATMTSIAAGNNVIDTTNLIITNNGNVGIGTTAPAYTLHVNGTIYAAGAAGALSDRRHKKDIEIYADDALAQVEQLRPVTFQWKNPLDNGMKGRQIGFIAQDVQTVVPDAVMTMNNEEKTLSLKYDSLIPVLTKAIQQLKAEDDKLTTQLDEQNRAIKELKADNDKLHLLVGEARGSKSNIKTAVSQ